MVLVFVVCLTAVKTFIVALELGFSPHYPRTVLVYKL